MATFITSNGRLRVRGVTSGGTTTTTTTAAIVIKHLLESTSLGTPFAGKGGYVKYPASTSTKINSAISSYLTSINRDYFSDCMITFRYMVFTSSTDADNFLLSKTVQSLGAEGSMFAYGNVIASGNLLDLTSSMISSYPNDSNIMDYVIETGDLDININDMKPRVILTANWVANDGNGSSRGWYQADGPFIEMIKLSSLV